MPVPEIERATFSPKTIRRKASELRYFWEELFSEAKDLPDGSLFHYLIRRGDTQWLIQRQGIRRAPALQVVRYVGTQIDGINIQAGSNPKFSYSTYGIDTINNATVFPLQTYENTDTAYKMVEAFGEDFAKGSA